MSLDAIIDELVEIYREHFDREARELWIKRVTATVPESVNEYPWLFFVADRGAVTPVTFATAHTRTVHYPGEDVTATVERPAADLLHQFKAQLLVCPRRNMLEDEGRTRPFIEPLITLALDNFRLAALSSVEFVMPTDYTYGAFPMGRVENPTYFMGVEVEFEAKEHV